MEEADLLKERLQAITDKRRIQEDIVKKRRQIEEEKLKLQYMKKKALRDHWLRDGVSQQSEEEQEAMRLQARDEQQQSDQLQSDILRIEKEIETLEAQELSISANEEVILKRLKEVERTAEDIIKEIKAEFQADLTQHCPLRDTPPFIPLTPAKTQPICQPCSEEPKKATFAVEISVEHDKKTGKSQVVSTAHITPETVQERGLKVYDDGRKSVYALCPNGGKMYSGAVGELTSTEVEEMLRQATDKNVPTEVQYHQPVYSVSYTGSGRPSTPKQTLALSHSPLQIAVLPRNGAQTLREENGQSQDLPGQKSQSQNSNYINIQQEALSGVQKPGAGAKLPYIPAQSKSDKDVIPQPYVGVKTQQGLSGPSPAALVSVKAKSEGMPTSLQPVYRAVGRHSPSVASNKSEVGPDASIESSDLFNRCSPNCAESLSQELQSGPITMIFMGYENAEDAEEDDFQAELVTIADSDDDDDDEDNRVKCEYEKGEYLSYHPEGCRSQVFQPKVGIAKVTRCRDNTFINWDDLGLHKPTFIHKPGKHSP